MAEQGPWIAIAGSAESARAQELGLKNPGDALKAAAAVGAELANHGCRIVIYSFRPEFIECDIAHGYLASGKAASKSIRLVYPYDSEPQLGDCERFRENFDFVPDRRSAWEISFYESLKKVDGLVLIGGGRSSLIAGILSVMEKRPVLALGGFGGAALEVWSYLPADLTTEDERKLMGQPQWSSASASQCVDALLRQRKQLLTEAAERQRQLENAKLSETKRRAALGWQSWIAAALLLIAVAIAAIVWNNPTRPGVLTTLLLFLTPFIAAMSGAMFRKPFDDFRGAPPTRSPAPAVWALGLVAGGLTALVYVVAQLVAFPSAIEGATAAAIEQARIEHASRILPTAMVTAFVAGFALDAVLSRFMKKGGGLEKGDGD